MQACPSVASAAAVSLWGKRTSARDKLAAIEATALAVEGAAALVSDHVYKARGVDAAFESGAGRRERIGAVGIGLLLPLGLLAGSAPLDRRNSRAQTIASVATLVGSFMLRSSMLGVGDESAARPDISFRFSTPDNLPKTRG